MTVVVLLGFLCLSQRLVLDYLLREGHAREGATLVLAGFLGYSDSDLAEYRADGVPFVSFMGDVLAAQQRPVHSLHSCCVGGGSSGGEVFVRLLAEAAAAHALLPLRLSGSVGDESEEEGGNEEGGSGWLSLDAVAALAAQASGSLTPESSR